MNNALEAFIQHQDVVHETWERIEQEVAAQGVEATLRRLAAYYQSGNGRGPVDELVLDLKRLVRAYVDELRQIHQFNPDARVLGPDNRVPPGPAREQVDEQ